ncbi:hypothetical protein AB0H34_19140 [Saccharopolyspora shandongensis]|uniref:hypothetical protein n=1 Tax=Saccharopolyspora shandongensis TaxID=418495 RepID=UPI0033ED3693
MADVHTGVPPGVELMAAYSFTKWAAGGFHRRPSGLLVVHTRPQAVPELLLARAVQRAAPACLADAAWLGVDEPPTLRSRINRYQRNLAALAEELEGLPGIDMRYQPGGGFIVIVDQHRRAGWAAAAASAVVRTAATAGVPAGRHGSYGLPGPSVSVQPGAQECGLRLLPGSGPASVTLRYAKAIRAALAHVPPPEPRPMEDAIAQRAGQ